MIKKTIILLLMFVSLLGYGQMKKVIPQKRISSIKNGTVMIVLEENDVYSQALKKVVEKNWTFSKYKFTTNQELKSKYEEKEIVPMFGFFDGIYRFTDYKGRSDFSYLDCLGVTWKFRTKTYYDIKGKDVIDLYIFRRDETLSSANSIEGKLTIATKHINDYLTIRENTENKVKNKASFLKYVNKKNIDEVKKKTLLIVEEDLSPKLKKSDITSSYEFDYQFVNKERLYEAIVNKEDVLIYYLDGNSQQIIWAKNTELLNYVTLSVFRGIKKVQKEMFHDFGKRLK